MPRLLLAILIGALLLGSNAAYAGGALHAGPVFYLDGDTITCQAVNVSTRALEDVLIELRDASGTLLSTGTCDLAPAEACGFSRNDITGNGRASCRVTTAGSAKGLRATLQNVDSGATSDAH